MAENSAGCSAGHVKVNGQPRSRVRNNAFEAFILAAVIEAMPKQQVQHLPLSRDKMLGYPPCIQGPPEKHIHNPHSTLDYRPR
jgi:hypothetical protein